jgi:hypothetical protein
MKTTIIATIESYYFDAKNLKVVCFDDEKRYHIYDVNHELSGKINDIRKLLKDKLSLKDDEIEIDRGLL